MAKSVAQFLRPEWLLVSAAIAALSYGSPLLADLLPTAQSPSSLKPYADIASFRPHYVLEHQDETTVKLHATGTTLSVLLTLFNPEFFAAGILAIMCGQIAFPVFRHHDHGAVEALVVLFVFFTTTKFLRGSVSTAVLVLLIGYAFAWTGHFFFEHNKPATLIYPTYSLVCDFLLWAETITGTTITI
ncbi:hypothetical protein Poli38472_004208 [Pythium oligandrum]|uniref:Uncharacterized protein n=1 Tax=Pythium oligandrum TaxID=41045 RepID=A0A8K1CQC9_PYTOL|nr:hypothetical protein Poli38472_004208 [Pythium oligandrum]|eukprot:TMW66443.1 hypothetical protein Poli38472_004208 [Pythium oligandrum]